MSAVDTVDVLIIHHKSTRIHKTRTFKYIHKTRGITQDKSKGRRRQRRLGAARLVHAWLAAGTLASFIHAAGGLRDAIVVVLGAVVAGVGFTSFDAGAGFTAIAGSLALSGSAAGAPTARRAGGEGTLHSVG